MDIKLDTTLGYLYFVDAAHPMASKSTGKVMVHRHEAAIKYARMLTSDEHVHHIDGNKLNNSHDNLEILSASEHGKEHSPRVYEKYQVSCSVCGTKFETSENSAKQHTCSTKCAGIRSRKFEISKEDLEVLLWHYPKVAIAKYFGVSDTAVKKRAISLGCLMPEARFHNKSIEYRINKLKECNIPPAPTLVF